MTTNPIVNLLSKITYLAILVHVIYSIIITIHNKKSRPIGYKANNPSQNSLWNSRNMGILGTIILIFLVIHLKSFWYEMKYGTLPFVDYGGGSLKNLYLIVTIAFSNLWYVVLYVVSMGALAFHLAHGFTSAFQTLGLSHVKYTPFIKKLSLLFAIIVPAIFAAMPIYLYLKTIVI